MASRIGDSQDRVSSVLEVYGFGGECNTVPLPLVAHQEGNKNFPFWSKTLCVCFSFKPPPPRFPFLIQLFQLT